MKKAVRLVVFSLFVLVAGSVGLVPANLTARASPTGPAWLTGWSYRKAHFLSYATTDIASYQLLIKVYFGSGSDSGNTVYCSSHCQPDFDDIRFTSWDGTTLLDHWRETYISGNYAYFWVESPVIDDHAGATIYMYYGNSAAASASNINTTFRKACDMEEGNLNDWQGSWGDTGYDSASTDHEHTGSRDMRLQYKSGGSTHGYYININGYGSGHAYRIWLYDYAYKVTNYEAGVIIEDYGVQFYLAARGTGNYYEYWDGSGWVATSVYRTAGFHYFEFRVGPTSIQGVVDGQVVRTSTRLDEANLYRFKTYGYLTSYYSWFDDCIVRRWLDPAPTHVGWAPEMGPPNGKSYEFSPYAWTLKWELVYSESQYVARVTDITFDADAVNDLFWADVEFWLKYTLDVTEIAYGGNYRVSSNGYWASNLPAPSFDRDDDPPADGLWEEAEITAQYTYQIQAYYAYYGYFGFDTYSAGWTQFQHSAQRSAWGFWEGEWGWQSLLSDVLQNFEAYVIAPIGGALRYLTPGTMSAEPALSDPADTTTTEDRIVFGSSLTTRCKYVVVEKGASRYRIRILPMLDTTQDFDQYSSWLSGRIDALEKDSPERLVPLVVTFNRPISIQELTAFVRDYNIDFERFEAKVLTNNGEEWTTGGVPSESALVDEGKFNAMLECIREATGDNNPEVLGICALWGTAPASSLPPMQEDNLVLLVDVSPAIILQEVQQHGFTGSFTWSLPDLFEYAIRYNVI